MNELSTMPVETMFQVAEIMQHNQLLPEHLRGKRNTKTRQWEPYSEVERKSICFSIINAAQLFGCNPMQLAEQSYVVHGKLDYSGAYYAALANTRGGLDQRLSYEFTGQGNARQVTVSGRIAGESMPRIVEMTVAEGMARGGENWKDDPDQMLCYAGARRWVRRHCPEVLLGLVPDEESEVKEFVQDFESKHPAKTEPPRIGGTADERPSGIVETFAEWQHLIDIADSKGQLKLLAARIDGCDSLSNDEKRALREAGRRRWQGLTVEAREHAELAQAVHAATATTYEPEPAQRPQEAAEGPSQEFRRWKRTLETEGDTETVIEGLAQIDDSDLPVAEKDELAKIGIARLQQVKGMGVRDE